MPTGIAAFIGDQDENAARITTKGHLRATESYDLVKNPSRMRVTSESGGIEFPTIAVGKMIIRSESGNNIMFVGGVTDDSPYSGRGMDLWGGESITLPVQNMNQIRVFAATSGQMISVLGFGTSTDVQFETNDPVFIDSTPPAISTVFPSSGSASAELNDLVYADFTETIASGTHNTSGFTLRLSGSSTNVPATVYRDTLTTNRLVLDPSSNLSGSKIYVARIGTQIKDLFNNTMTTSGAWFFTTVGTAPPADTTRPVVSGHSPVSGATNVAITTSPTITMSEKILSTTVSGWFLLNISGSAAVAATTTLGADTKTVTINPTSDLQNSKLYQLRVLSGVKDLAGNNLNTPITSKFTTVAPSLNIVYNVTHNNSSNQLFDGDDTAEGMLVRTSASDMEGVLIQQVRVSMRKEGSPTGGIICKQFASDGATSSRIGASMDASELTSSFADYTFTEGTGSTNTPLAVNERVAIEFLDGDSDNYVEIRRNTTDAFDGGDTCRTYRKADGTWVNETGNDFAAIMWE